MPDQNPKRKLTTILYADVVGYSRLTGQDELDTHQRVMEVLDHASDAIKRGEGTVLRYAGDALLAEFPSVVGAVNTAVGIQNELALRAAEIADDGKVQIRIGLNLGEVLLDRGEIFGDGVNLAARLESIAQPGGLCVSALVHDQVKDKVDIDFKDGGEEQLKNIETPARVYHWHPGISSDVGHGDGPPLPDKPSIAVLPFDNMSNDPEQEFFADGITEDIITELSREKDLFVIARNSTFAYKEKSIDVRRVARELGVQFVLEGSVRKVGNRIRLNAQLIEAEQNHHVWAERYDRALEDVFDVQEELTTTISNTLLQKFRDVNIERAMRRAPKSLAAYDHYLRAFGSLLRLNKSDGEKAIYEAREALELEPDYARAHMVLAWAHGYRTFAGWAEDLEEELRLWREAAQKSINCDKDDFWGYGALAFAELFAGNHERALNAIDQAVVLNPNSADSHALRAMILNFTGEPEKGLKDMAVAVRLNPNHPHWYLVGLGRAYFHLGRFEQAIPYLERLVDAGEDIVAWRALLAAAYMGAARKDEARAEISTLMESTPEVSCEFIRARVPMRHEQSLENYMRLLAAAGLPDGPEPKES